LQGLRAVLRESGHNVVRSASTAEGLRSALAARPDTEVVVVGTLDADPVALVHDLRDLAPTAQVLALVEEVALGETAAEVLHGLLQAGATGLSGRSTTTDLGFAVSRVGEGERFLSEPILRRLLPTGRHLTPTGEAQGLLTAREEEILRCLVDGLGNREIADRLYIGESTVKTHLASIYGKLEAGNRQDAVARGFELGILPDRRRGARVAASS
jgi:DNA-binding NarL/FixJ family response regulator